MSTSPQLLGDGTWLRSVRLHGGDADRLRARQRLEQALARVDWACTGQSARSVLLVRHLRARPGASEGLGADIARALRDKARHARRPWTQPEAAVAEAVWFADADELVACLVRDWLAGALPERWWWPGVLAGAGVDRWLHEHVLTRGQQLVPVVAQLAERGDAVRWMARLDEASANLALAAVARSHGVSCVVAARADRSAESPSTAIDGASSMSPDDGRATAQADARHLERLVPELGSAVLAPPSTRLLAWTLALAREPGWARRPAFERALEARLSARGSRASARPASGRQTARSASGPAAGDHASNARDVLASPLAEPRSPPARHPIETGATPPPAVAASSLTSSARKDGRRRARDDAPRSPPASAPPRAHATPPRARQDATPATPGASRAIGHGANAARTTMPSDPAEAPRPPTYAGARAAGQALPAVFPRVIHTRFGGLFYLLNAALAMGLYGDFTQPRTRGIALSPWNWLAWLGQDWLGTEFVDDPAWTLLAELAGRGPQHAPARDFDAPRTWQLANDALAPWRPAAAVHYRASRTRLRIDHPAGFALFDGPRDPGVAPRLQAARVLRELPALGDPVAHRDRLPAARSPRKRRVRWLAAMSACLRARLARALGLDDPAAAGAVVCRQAATLRVTHGAIDVHLVLSDLPLAIRFAGLDRDPGWIPAAGRSVAFHFD